jgi:hypothetical protein
MHIEVQQHGTGETSMRVIPTDQRLGAAHGAARRRGFWQRLAQTPDDYLAELTKPVVPVATLRRSRHEIDCCRRLMLKGALTHRPMA